MCICLPLHPVSRNRPLERGVGIGRVGRVEERRGCGGLRRRLREWCVREKLVGDGLEAKVAEGKCYVARVVTVGEEATKVLVYELRKYHKL